MIADPTIAHFVACFAGGPCTTGELVTACIIGLASGPAAVLLYSIIVRPWQRTKE
jgi:hypothetical protein